MEMAREEKRFELRPVDEVVEVKTPVVRLESQETLQNPKPVRLKVPPEPEKVSQRLDLPARDDIESRTHQPGIEALIEPEVTNPDFLEHDWGKDSTQQHGIPWGWFALIGLILAGGILWSLSGVKDSEIQAEKLREETNIVLGVDAKEEFEAGRLVDRIQAVTRQYFEATSVKDLAGLVRHPERVRPLMEKHYGGRPVPVNRVARHSLLKPLTLDNRADFWMATVELEDGQKSNLVVEILENGEPRIDWETHVCYQPMNWDTFATQRPAGTSMDFRVYIQQDNFFSHEFTDSDRWKCFRLTTLNGEETLFGYAAVGEETAKALIKLENDNRGRKTSAILRLSIPEGIQSRRGVVIEKLLSPRWLYVDPPEA